MQDLIAELSSKGFSPGSLNLDGKIHRFDRGGHGNAWIIGFQNHRVNDGSSYIVAQYGDWKTGEVHIFKPSKLSTVDTEAFKRQIAAAKKRVEDEKKIRNEECATKAARYFASSKREGRTPYMDRKKIQELYGCGIHGDTLQVPMRDAEGKLWSLQNIKPDGSKLFLSGTKVEGNFHVIGGELGPGAEVFLCEGFATGASIHEATGRLTVVAFNAGNLAPVAKALKTKWPDLTITICADDDRFHEDGKNPGLEYAAKAALVAQAAVITPRFKSDDGRPTDFNDLHTFEGLSACKRQLFPVEHPSPSVGFVPLGYDEGTYFFYHIPSQDIVKANVFSNVQLYQIAPAAYWRERYPNGNGTDADMKAAIDDLIQMSRRVGPFDSGRVRGAGVWIDETHTVINMGRGLIVDNREMSMTAHRSAYIYVQTRDRLPPMEAPLTAKECQPLIDACTGLRWSDPKAGYLLAGWIMVARIAGALPIRPHIWLTGGAGTGKTTVMGMVANALGSPKGRLYLQGASTEAGIRQRIKASSIPIVFDEFETEGRASRDRVISLIELLRSAWSDSQGGILKGSAGGISQEYLLRTAALVSSIRVNLPTDADRSRFSILELKPHGNSADQREKVMRAFNAITAPYGDRLFARASAMVSVIRESQRAISDALAGVISQRFGQQVGTILAGWWALQSDRAITRDEALELAHGMDLGEERDDAAETDEQECLQHLLTTKVTLRSGMSVADLTIGEAIEQPGWHENLMSYGVRVSGERIFISNCHTELARIFANTRWVQWARTLARLPGAQRCERMSWGSRDIKSRAISVPLTRG